MTEEISVGEISVGEISVGEISVGEIAVEEVSLGKCPDTLPVFVNCSNNVVLTTPRSDL